ncbi:MAG: hypothetical protein HKN47_25370 [Pirellulaceae bacterium]|nr:hypothetical protein [Pirellulaceae bacterium]
MPRKWFIKSRSGYLGPVSSAKLVRLASDGRLTPNMGVSRDGKTWVKAKKISGLSFPNDRSADATARDTSAQTNAKTRQRSKSRDRSNPEAASDSWFVQTKHSVAGPFSVAQLQKLVRKGRLQRNVAVSRDREHWIKAKRVPGLEFLNIDASEFAAHSAPVSDRPETISPPVPNRRRSVAALPVISELPIVGPLPLISDLPPRDRVRILVPVPVVDELPIVGRLPLLGDLPPRDRPRILASLPVVDELPIVGPFPTRADLPPRGVARKTFPLPVVADLPLSGPLPRLADLPTRTPKRVVVPLPVVNELPILGSLPTIADLSARQRDPMATRLPVIHELPIVGDLPTLDADVIRRVTQPATIDPDWAVRRESEYVRRFGPSSHVSQLPAESGNTHRVSIHPANQHRPVTTLVTSGMSDQAMTVPEGAWSPRAELVLYVNDAQTQYEEMLLWLASIPHQQGRGFHYGLTLGNGVPPTPIFPGSELTSFLFLMPRVRSDFDIQQTIQIDRNPLQLLWVVPITSAERAFVMRQGVYEFCKLLDKHDHELVIDPNRRCFIESADNVAG